MGIYKTLISSALCILLVSCTGGQHIRNVLAEPDTKEDFVASIYFSATPLAEIINMPDRQDLEQSFEIDKDQDVQIYGVGELIYNLADVPSKYFFKGDDIEVFFKCQKVMATVQKEYQFIFPFSSTLPHKGGRRDMRLTPAVNLNGLLWKDSINNKFYAAMKFAWAALELNPFRNGRQLGFEIVLADDDDRFKQKGKLALFEKNQDPLYAIPRTYGTLVCRPRQHKDNTPKDPGIINAYPKPSNLLISDPVSWRSIPEVEIGNTVMGIIRNKYDLSGKLRCCWDTDSLYLLADIQDNRFVKVGKDKMEGERTFADYGWIENEKGEKVWEMKAANSSYAGGALKNHKVSAILHLKAGKYKLKYSTDESHAYLNWDSPSPTTSFYGIVVYEKR